MKDEKMTTGKNTDILKIITSIEFANWCKEKDWRYAPSYGADSKKPGTIKSIRISTEFPILKLLKSSKILWIFTLNRRTKTQIETTIFHNHPKH